jgi:hypothetical protein
VRPVSACSNGSIWHERIESRLVKLFEIPLSVMKRSYHATM